MERLNDEQLNVLDKEILEFYSTPRFSTGG